MATRSTSRHVAGAIAVAAVVQGGAGVARAGAPAAWQVPDECGGSERLAARVSAQLGRPLETEPMSIDVAIAPGPDGGYHAHVEMDSVYGAAERDLTGADCGAVVDAVVLVLAVAMHDVPQLADDEVTEPVAPAPRAPARLLVGAGVGVDRGALPSSSPGASVVLALVRGAWRVELGGEVYQAAFAPTPEDDMRGVDVGLLGGRARLCHGVGPLRACVGGALGRLEGRPVVLNEPATQSRRWSAVTAGLGWSYRFGGRFALGLDVDGVLAIDRPEFVTSDDVRLHQPAATGVRASCGLEVEIR